MIQKILLILFNLSTIRYDEEFEEMLRPKSELSKLLKSVTERKGYKNMEYDKRKVYCIFSNFLYVICLL